MAEYGNGISMTRAFTLDKERIKHALNGELACGENEDGFVYAKADKEACDNYIISAYENAVYYALTMNESACALEKLMGTVKLPDYAKALDEVKHEHLKRG